MSSYEEQGWMAVTYREPMQRCSFKVFLVGNAYEKHDHTSWRLRPCRGTKRLSASGLLSIQYQDLWKCLALKSSRKPGWCRTRISHRLGQRICELLDRVAEDGTRRHLQEIFWSFQSRRHGILRRVLAKLDIQLYIYIQGRWLTLTCSISHEEPISVAYWA